MLHQFLSAETIQVSEEWILFVFLGILFLGHDRTVRDLPPYVNDIAPGLLIQFQMERKAARPKNGRPLQNLLATGLFAIGNAQALADRDGSVLKIREA